MQRPLLSECPLPFQEVIFLYRIKRHKRQDNRCAGYIFPVFGIRAVAPVLPDFQTTGTSEHDIDYT